MVHLKTTEDKVRNVKISASLALELLGGLIKVEGSGSYELDECSNTTEEQLKCTYDVVNYSVSLLPQSKEAMDEHVMEMLFKQQIKATHVVKSVTVGAHVDANIRIRELKSSKKDKIEASVMGKLIIGPVFNKLLKNIKDLRKSS